MPDMSALALHGVTTSIMGWAWSAMKLTPHDHIVSQETGGRYQFLTIQTYARPRPRILHTTVDHVPFSLTRLDSSWQEYTWPSPWSAISSPVVPVPFFEASRHLTPPVIRPVLEFASTIKKMLLMIALPVSRGHHTLFQGILTTHGHIDLLHRHDRLLVSLPLFP